MHTPVPVVIDTDPGIDDVVALALALTSPELDVVAITTTYGNATLQQTTRNVRSLLELVQRTDVPVYPGADRPLLRDLVTAPETHGPTGVGYAPVPAAAAVERDLLALQRILAASPGPVVLVTLGPLTNLALALEADEQLVRESLAGHLGMFGSLHERGSTKRWADFNAWCDPEAADRVVRAGLGTVMVGLDVTRRMTLTAEEVEALAGSESAITSWLGRALRFSVESHRRQGRLDGCVVNDVLPIGEVLSPGMLTLAEARLTIDLGDGDHKGRTCPDPQGGELQVALGADISKMKRMLERVTKEA